MNLTQAIRFATEQGVTVCDNRRDKQFEWIKVSKGDDTVTVQRSVFKQGACWMICGPLIPQARYEHGEFKDLRCGVAIERAVELLSGWYS